MVVKAYRWLHYSMVVFHTDAAIPAFLVLLLLKCCDMLHYCLLLSSVAFIWYIIKHSPVARSSIQKFDNDCDVILMLKHVIEHRFSWN